MLRYSFVVWFPVALFAAAQAHAQAAAVDPLAAFRCEQAHSSANYGSALRDCRPLAEQGLADAQLILGDLYQRGLGVSQNQAEAARWYRAAAEQGLTLAQFNLGLMYRYGSGVRQDLIEAHAWLSIAADRGHADAGAARDQTAQRMSVSQLASARTLATERRARLAGTPPPPAAQPQQQAAVPPVLSGRELVGAVQSRLTQLGYDPGPADGLMGSRTRNSIVAFQSRVGLSADGQANMTVLRRLDQELAARRVAAPAPAPAPAPAAPAAPAPIAALPEPAAGLPGAGVVAGYEPHTQGLVDEIKTQLARAQTRRTAQPAFLGELRAIVSRYDWPWRDRRLQDDFADGNFTVNPAWTVAAGSFAVDARGLTSRYAAPTQPAQAAPRENRDVAAQIFGAILQEAIRRRDDQPAAPPPAAPEIFAPVRIANAFALTAGLTASAFEGRRNRLLLSVYQGALRDTGYVLAIQPGPQTRIELLRLTGGRSTVIQTAVVPAGITSTRPAELSWRRGVNGEMAVIIDGTEVMRATDRGISGAFAGVRVVNEGGEYALKRIAVHAAPG